MKKADVFAVLRAAIGNNLTNAANQVYTSESILGTKLANSKMEHVVMPTGQEPYSAGEKHIEKKPKPEAEDEGSIGQSRTENATVNPPCMQETPLVNKLAAVLAPKIQQAIENERAMQAARESVRVPQNVNVKRYAMPSANIPPPIGMAQAPAPAQPTAPSPQPQQNGLPSVNGKGGSPQSNPINSFGGISMSGAFNGNASLGTANAPGAKMAAQKCSCGCGQKVNECTCPESCSCRQKGGSCYGLKKQAGNNDVLAWLMSIDNSNIPDPEDLDYDERMKSAAIGLWDRIRAKKERGGKPAKPGDKDYPDAKSWKKVTSISEKKSSKQASLSASELTRMGLPIALGGIGGSLAGSYGPLLAGGKPSLATGIGSTMGGTAAGALYAYYDLVNRSKKERDALREKKKTTEQDQRNLAELETHYPDKQAASSPAWQRSAGKNEEGGLNAKGRASYNKATGGNLKAPVTESNPKGDRAKRQNSFCSRMCGMKRVNTGAKTKKDPDSRINKSLRKWNCKCSAASMFGAKVAQDFDPAMSRDAENAIMHGTGLVGSAALGTAAGFPLTAGLGALAERNNWIPDSNKNFLGNTLVNTALKLPMFLGGTLGMSLYDNYILRPHMKRELARKQEEEQVRQMLQKQSSASMGRVLGTALASTGGGLLLGAYPGWKLQRASEAAGNSDFTSFVAGKAPIALSGALSAGLYNHWLDSYDKKKKAPAKPEPESVAKYMQYLVH